MNVEGRVLIELPLKRGAPVKVDFDRPGNVTGLFKGRAPKNVLSMIPSVFSLCASAQGHAAVVALEQATGRSVSPMTAAARMAVTGMETVREHVLRIALDWPGFVSERPRGAQVRPAMVLVGQFTRALFGTERCFSIGLEADPDRKVAGAIIDEAEALLVREVFAEPIEHWLARTSETEIRTWAQKSETVAARLIDRVFNSSWVAAGDTPAIMMPRPVAGNVRDWLDRSRQRCDILPEPHLDDVPETTLFSRRSHEATLKVFAGGGLGPRLLARLVELARLPDELRALIAEDNGRSADVSETDGFGWSAIDAARGLLIHAVTVNGERIEDYRVLPPTRWNFDAEGVAKRCLTGIDEADTDKRLQQANLIVNAIDPCVAHEVRVH